MAFLQRAKHGVHRDFAGDVQAHLAVHACESA
jgi:hypothetical protein